MSSIPKPSLGGKDYTSASKDLGAGETSTTTTTASSKKKADDDEKAYQLTKRLFETLSAPEILSLDKYSPGIINLSLSLSLSLSLCIFIYLFFSEIMSSLRNWILEFNKKGGQISGVTWEWVIEIVTTCLELHIFPPLKEGSDGSNSNNNSDNSSDKQQWDEEEVLFFLTKFQPYLNLQRAFVLCNQLRFENCLRLMHQWEDDFEAEFEKIQQGLLDGTADVDVSIVREKSNRSKKALWTSLDDMLSVRPSFYCFFGVGGGG